MRPVDLFVDGCVQTLPMLRAEPLGARWHAPSVLEQWSNAGLAGHLARSPFNLERAVGNLAGNSEALDAVAYYAFADPEPPDSPVGRRIREFGDEEAAAGQSVLAQRFADSIEALRRKATPLPVGTRVNMFGRVLTVDECAVACLLELVVHADDLAASVGVRPPPFSEPIVDLATTTLSRIARIRHGDYAVLRTLSRAERAPVGGISAFDHTQVTEAEGYCGPNANDHRLH
jgi:Mycothiol maleylpyruvate isomerase N-terminal domain